MSNSILKKLKLKTGRINSSYSKLKEGSLRLLELGLSSCRLEPHIGIDTSLKYVKYMNLYFSNHMT